jgi:hypothetical protein
MDALASRAKNAAVWVAVVVGLLVVAAGVYAAARSPGVQKVISQQFAAQDAADRKWCDENRLPRETMRECLARLHQDEADQESDRHE